MIFLEWDLAFDVLFCLAFVCLACLAPSQMEDVASLDRHIDEVIATKRASLRADEVKVEDDEDPERAADAARRDAASSSSEAGTAPKPKEAKNKDRASLQMYTRMDKEFILILVLVLEVPKIGFGVPKLWCAVKGTGKDPCEGAPHSLSTKVEKLRGGLQRWARNKI